MKHNKAESTLFGTLSRVSHPMISTENPEKEGNNDYGVINRPIMTIDQLVVGTSTKILTLWIYTFEVDGRWPLTKKKKNMRGLF